MGHFIIVLLVSALTAQAETFGNWTYNVITSTDFGVSNTAAIVGYTGSGGEISIPTSINEMLVTRIGLPVIPESNLGTGNTISTFTIPDSLTGIGSSAFSTSTGVLTITIPSSVAEIGRRTFFNCPELTSINVAPDNLYYSSQEGVLYNKNKTVLIAFPCGRAGAFTIPSSVTRIYNEAFKGATKLTAIIIPDTVTSIGYEAFADCSGLTSVNLPNNLDTIEYGTFARCTSLSSITFPNHVFAIWRHAFLDCTNLRGISFPESLGLFDTESFKGCYNLTSAYFHGSCPSLVMMSIPDLILPVANIYLNSTSFKAAIGFSDNTSILYRFGTSGWYNYYPAASPTELVPPKITNASSSVIDGISRFKITFETFPDWQYSVQKSSDLVNWSTVSTFTGIGTPMEYEEISADRAFYRIHLYWAWSGN